MGAQFSSLRNAFQAFQNAKSKVLAFSEICIATGVRTEEYELALEMYGRCKDLCRRACRYLVIYYTAWMHNAKMLLILLRTLEEKRSTMSRSILETCRRMILHYCNILCAFDDDGNGVAVARRLISRSQYLPRIISKALAEIDLNGDENGEAVEEDRAAAEGNQEQNQDLPDTDSGNN